MLAAERAQMLAEARAWKNIHMEVQARMCVEARTQMLAEACEWMFILGVLTFLLRLKMCTQACPYIYIQGMGVHRGTSMEIYTVKTSV